MQLRSSQKPTRRPPQLRYRRVGGGYRPDDVEETLGGVRRTVRRLEEELEELRERAMSLEADLAGARGDLAAYRSQSLAPMEPAPPFDEHQLFETRVELDAGPFSEPGDVTAFDVRAATAARLVLDLRPR